MGISIKSSVIYLRSLDDRVPITPQIIMYILL